MMDLIVLALLVCGVASEAPYAPSGWKPNGPAFELPDPRNRTPQKQEYLPPNTRTTSQEYGPPEVDVSVQGLPTQEQLPIFQLSPVNGQQYVGPRFNNDLRNLEQNLRNSQLQEQQRINREFARQRELDAAFSNANRQNQPAPRQLALNPTSPKTDDVRTTTVEATTEALKLNQGEVENGKDKKENVSVEVSRQNIQEYPPELFLTPLAQLQLQNQYNPVQLGQLRAPIYLEPSQNYQAAQLQALPAYLAQQQLLQAQLAQTQAQLVQAQAQLVQPLAQAQPQLVQPQVEQQGVAQSPAYLVPEDQAAFIPQQQGVPVQYQLANQYAPANQYDTAQVYPQQPIFLQPQENQLLPRPKDPQVVEQDQAQQIQPQSQFVYQYQQPQLQQPQYQQPQLQQPQLQQSQYQQPQLQQPQYQQPQLQQPQYQQPQLQQPQYQQPQYQQPQYQQPQYQQPQYQIQYQHPLDSYQQDLLQPQIFVQDSQAQQARQPNSLQSGFNVNQQGNGLEEDKDEEQDDGSTATAVATAFGTRTQPRTSYGAPNAQAKPGYHYRTTEEATTEVSTEDGPAIAEATAVSKGSRPAKQRSRQGRVRPVFTLDRSGHLVLAQDQ